MFHRFSGSADAPPVLLLHGGGVAGWMWDPVRDRLERNHLVLIPDLPGHDRSAEMPYVSHADTVAQLAQLLEATVPGRTATVIGFSLGAQLAILLAAHHPDLVSRAVVVSAQVEPLPSTPLTLAALRLSAPLARRRWFARAQARQLRIPSHLMADYLRTSAALTAPSLVAAVGENLRFRLPAAWSSFPGRALVMVGAREPRVMLASAASIHDALPGSHRDIVEGCGHGIPLERPEWFADHVTEWLGRSRRGRSAPR